MSPTRLLACSAALLVIVVSTPAPAEDLSFSDPSGDDFGPGTYTYPTDAVYKRGSFDLKSVELKDDGDDVEIRVTVNAKIEDPWDSKSWDGNGFSIQMVQIYLDTDGAPGSGFTSALPGINATFAPADAWDRAVIISPQGKRRLSAEVKAKAGKLKSGVVIPKRVKVRGKTLIATVSKEDLGGAPTKSWGVQAVMQSNEGYPTAKEILSRKVNEYGGQHRFGGGSDWDCDPHVIDILVAPAEGSGGEKDGQKKALQYKCGAEGEVEKAAVLPMIRKA